MGVSTVCVVCRRRRRKATREMFGQKEEKWRERCATVRAAVCCSSVDFKENEMGREGENCRNYSIIRL